MDYTDCGESCLLGYEAMYSGRNTPILWRERATSFTGTQETAGSLKRRFYTRLHGVTHQKTALIIAIAFRCLNPTTIVISYQNSFSR
jgi:hypothetical protein